MRLFVVIAISSAFVGRAAAAEPLVQRLPKDGVGQKFHVNLTVDGREQIQEWILQSVGSSQVEGKPARWIEMVGGSKNFRIIYKLLILESDFGIGKHPVSKAKQVWRKRGNSKPEKIKDIKTDDIFFWHLLCGPSQLKKTDEKHNVQWQKGMFECEVKTGSSKFDLLVGSVQITHRVYSSKDSPFGLCGGKHEFIGMFGTRKRTACIEYTVTDIIKNAKPAFAITQ
jgi:hypothetical protein